MGLLILRDKIEEKFIQGGYSEADVLYLIIEIRKYLERSSKDLNDPIKIKLKESEYPTIKFFRNWIGHPEKHSEDIPEKIMNQLKKVSLNHNENIEKELFDFLIDEIKKFLIEIRPRERTEIKIDWDIFLNNLKKILAEQPINISITKKIIGYDELLILKEL